eukprot:CAMPEP_0119379918 /NCGR_PEP_ID=MMETSP1334-20130426/54684_1 /TAXON_ID=127549 /ORGANISM="Calcidiscus leptoporus, Strain RCC1130" /LENGTH=210 /DNA_ID=CAMNT_0007399567 /DNA_START=149 /DNA_END=781 /DNA_ORIENTATION=+
MKKQRSGAGDLRGQPAQTPAASQQRGRAPEASADEIVRLAENVVKDVAARFPEYAVIARRVALETSTTMTSSGAKTVFDVRPDGGEPHPRCIRISVPIFKRRSNLDSSLRDVVLHELAHVFAGRAAAHGERWRRICKQIGGTAALGHSLSCGAGESSGMPPPRQRTGIAKSSKVESKRRSGRDTTGGASSHETSSWKRASDNLISQLMRF